jgi:hypothetical protein
MTGEPAARSTGGSARALTVTRAPGPHACVSKVAVPMLVGISTWLRAIRRVETL